MVSLALGQPGDYRYRGLVLASGGIGALTLNNIQKLGKLPVLVIPGHGHTASEGMLQHYQIAKEHGKASHIQVLSQRRWPWSIALPLASREIEAFIARVLGEPPPAAPPASRPASRPESRPTSRSSR